MYESLHCCPKAELGEEYESEDLQDGYEWQLIPSGVAMPAGCMYRMDFDTQQSFVSWPVNKPLPWTTKKGPAELGVASTANEPSASHTQALDLKEESMEDDGSGAHPAAKQEVKEEDAKQKTKKKRLSKR